MSKYEIYEAIKAILKELNLTNEEYEKAIREIAKLLEI